MKLPNIFGTIFYTLLAKKNNEKNFLQISIDMIIEIHPTTFKEFKSSNNVLLWKQVINDERIILNNKTSDIIKVQTN